MTQVILKNLPSTIAYTEINFAIPESVNKEVIVETIEYLEDFLYISNRKNDVELVEEKEVLDLISKYK